MRIGDISNTDELQILIKAIEHVRIKANEDWQTIDVITSILSGNAQYLIDDERILVYYLTGNNKNIFWLWIAYSPTHNAFNDYYDKVRDYAKILGCTEIKWTSKRPAYKRLLTKLNATIDFVQYTTNI